MGANALTAGTAVLPWFGHLSKQESLNLGNSKAKLNDINKLTPLEMRNAEARFKLKTSYTFSHGVDGLYKIFLTGLTLKVFSHSAPFLPTSFPRKRARISSSSPALRRESRGVAHEAMKLSYFLPAPGFRVKPGMTIARAKAWQKKNVSSFMSFTII